MGLCEAENSLKPTCEIPIKSVPALVQPVPAAGIEDQLLWISCSGVDVPGAGGWQDLIGLAVHQ